jgi:hypothetical protein
MGILKNILSLKVFEKSNKSAKKISTFISPFQFQRAKQDIASWRDSINESENDYYPHRVKMQRIFMDTVINGHVSACVRKRKNLTLLKDFALFNGESPNEDATNLLKNKWFYNCINYVLDATFYGYSLIEFGDLDKNSFNELNIVKRENISPDRLTVNSIIYQINGVSFSNETEKDDNGNSFFDWTLYVDTPSERGNKCGYGLLYEVAPYEILLRNILGYNSDYVEVYGQPLKHAKSNKLEGEEYDALENSLANMASNPYLITDHETSVEFVTPGSGKGGHEVYSTFEKRLEDKITKIFFGHSSAMDSVSGKLGSSDEIKEALKEIESVDCRLVEYVVNSKLIPKLINLGFPISKGLVFKFKNDKEKEAFRLKEDQSNKMIADIAKILKDAGLQMDAKYFSERTNIPVTLIEAIEKTNDLSNEVKNKLSYIYNEL